MSMVDINVARNEGPATLDAKHAAAQAAFENFDFQGLAVTESGDWIAARLGSEMIRKVSLSAGDDGEPVDAIFVVLFKENSAEVDEAYAYNQPGVANLLHVS